MPGTAAICSTGASRIRLVEPNTRRRACLRLGPTPGRSSKTDRTGSLGPQVAVIGDREAMGLVAQALDQVQRGRRRRQQDRVGATGQEQLLAFLGQAGQRDIVEAELGEDLGRGADLALAAVDDHQVGQPPAELLGTALLGRRCPPEAPPEDLLVAGEVVGAVDRLDPEAAIVTGPRLAVLEDDHAGDRLGALEVADVVALDPEWRVGQPERLAQLGQGTQGLALVGQPANLLAIERLGRHCAGPARGAAASRRAGDT